MPKCIFKTSLNFHSRLLKGIVFKCLYFGKIRIGYYSWRIPEYHVIHHLTCGLTLSFILWILSKVLQSWFSKYLIWTLQGKVSKIAPKCIVFFSFPPLHKIYSLRIMIKAQSVQIRCYPTLRCPYLWLENSCFHFFPFRFSSKRHSMVNATDNTAFLEYWY